MKKYETRAPNGETTRVPGGMPTTEPVYDALDVAIRASTK
jgi:hypothetical protein